MSKKKTPDEFAAMAKLHEVLKPFSAEAINRMWFAVEAKLKAETPKKRVRKAKQPLTGEVINQILGISDSELN